MDPTRFQRIKDLFAAASELSPERRSSFLERRCGDDEELRREVEELLESDSRAADGLLARALQTKAAPKDRVHPQRPPERVGPFLVREILGEGGMGAVYLAEQHEPIRRKVALKLIRPGFETDSVVARFESERQALALMDHPNIARAIDAGTTDDGRPYFVMEYVAGVPITEYCDKHRLKTRERVELLAQVLDGLHHAHQKAIIHRDVKPSNVLVAEVDGKPLPKIIDFGVAKATGQALTQRTLFTELGQIIGTPEYMSPEQADLSGENIDTRTDIYSVGVLMYEVLVGVLPFDPKELRRGGFDEILRRIREDDPPRPSTRLSTLADETKVAVERRGTTVHRLSLQLRGDLDWITMKALEKDRGRRYRSAAEFADDLRRFQRSEPVSAGPPSATYRARKWVQRHRIGATFCALATLFLTAFLVTNYRKSVVIAAERDRVAEEARSARHMTDFLIGLFEDADPDGVRRAELTVREVLDAGAGELNELDTEPHAQASLRESIGSVYGNMGLFDEALPLLEAARDYREAANDGSEARELALATSLVELARLHVRSGRPDEGLPLARRAVDLRERYLGDGPELANAVNTVGNALWNTGDHAGAEAEHRRALELRERALGPRHPDTAASYHNVGSLRFIGGDLEEGERLYKRSLEVLRAADRMETASAATTMHTLAMVLAQKGEFAEALKLEEDSLRIREAVFGSEHPHVALSLTTLGEIHLGLGTPEEAVPLLERAVEIGTAKWGSDYPDVWWMRRWHATLLNAVGRHAEALVVMDAVLERVEAAEYKAENDLHLMERGASLRGLDRLDEAEAAYRRALEVLDDEGVTAADAAPARLGLAAVLADAGRGDEARPMFEAALGVLAEERGPRDPERVKGLQEYARFLRAAGDDARAAEVEAQHE